MPKRKSRSRSMMAFQILVWMEMPVPNLPWRDSSLKVQTALFTKWTVSTMQIREWAQH